MYYWTPGAEPPAGLAELSLNGGGSLCVLYHSYGSLLHASLRALASPNESLNAAAAEAILPPTNPQSNHNQPTIFPQSTPQSPPKAILELLSATNTQLSPSVPESVDVVEQMSAALSALACELDLARSIKDGGEVDERQFRFCRVLGVFCERGADVIAVTSGELLPLAQLMLVCLGAELRLAETSVKFWMGLQDTTPTHRNPQLCAPLYRESHCTHFFPFATPYSSHFLHAFLSI